MIYLAIFEFDPLPFLCWLCDLVGAVISGFPSTPAHLTIAGLITSAGNAMPLIGTGILVESFVLVRSIFGLFLVIKIVRLVSYLKPW
jgi:hypothetical protein